MNTHYTEAVESLEDLKRAGRSSASLALALAQISATLALATEQAATARALETANLIAYAQLRRDRRRPSLATEELVDRRMAAFPEIAEESAEDRDDDLDL